MYENAINAMYKKAMQSFVIKRILLLSSSKRLKLEVLRVLQKLEYKFLRKNYSQINAFLILVVVG